MRTRLPLMTASCAWIVIASVLAPAQTAQTQHEMHRLHGDPKAYIAALEDPKRDGYQKPHDVLRALDLKQGEVIADIGAGSGYFSFRLAMHVGDTGRIYAVDISPDMILHLNRRARELGASNVVTLLVPPDDPLLPDRSVDRLFITDTWHHIDHQEAYLGKLRKALKPGGQVVIIDFHKKDLPVGPPAEMKIAKEDVIRRFGQNGFALVKEHTFLPYQYFLVFSLQ